MLCCCCLKITNDLQVKGPAISLCTGLQIKYPVLLRTSQGRGFCLCLHRCSSGQWGLLSSRNSQEEERGKRLVSLPPRAAPPYVCSSPSSLPSCSPHTHTYAAERRAVIGLRSRPTPIFPPIPTMKHSTGHHKKSPLTLLKHSILRTHWSAEQLTPGEL